MKKALNLLFLLVCLLTAHLGNAQINLRLGLASAPPASIDTGQSFVINVTVTNNDTATFIDTVDFGYYANGGTLGTGSNTGSGFSYQVKNDTINPFDSIVKTLTAHVTNPAFLAGPSVVVIWPIAFGQNIIADSLRFNITVTVPNGNSIDELGDKRIRLILINDELQLLKDDGVQLKQLRVYDVLGNEILNKLNPTSNTALPPMNTGLYFAEVTYNNNQRRVFRFYH